MMMIKSPHAFISRCIAVRVARRRVGVHQAAAAPGSGSGASAKPLAMNASTEAGRWRRLGTPRSELVLDNTLPTGQSFRWRPTSPGVYTGVVGQRVVQLRQLPSDVEWRVLARGPSADADGDAAALRDYLNLETSLTALAEGWAAADARFAALAPHLPGCRMLRQDPVETLFSFICSSNNHISRIHGMVERLCSSHGTLLLPAADGTVKEEPQQRGSNGEPLDPLTPPVLASSCGEADGQELRERSMLLPLQPAVQLALEPPQPLLPASEHAFYAFPTLEQLKAATEDELRAAGFGYRARFIVGAVAALRDMPQGGAAWLQGLRKEPYAAAHEALCALPGIGPKVAACICLFALDKHDAIPVDTHVWALATRHYARHLAGKALTPKLHGAVQEAFVNRFGPYAGWAHNTLFVAEVASRRGALPDGAAAAPGGVRRGRRSSDASDVEVEIGKDEVSHNASTPAAECTTPAASRRRARKRSARFTDYVATSDVSDLATTSDSDS